jgi:hypothetical protein
MFTPFFTRRSLFSLPLLLSAVLPNLTQCQQSIKFSCLPEGRDLTDVVEFIPNDSGELSTFQRVTLADTLERLGARCNGQNQLVDATNRGIHFHHQIGCGGAFPSPELLQQMAEDLAALQRDYTVISMTCQSLGQPIP